MHGKTSYFEADPNKPYGNALIVSSQKELAMETKTGLNSTKFWVRNVSGVKSLEAAVMYTVELHCNIKETPWCLPSLPEKRPGPNASAF